jgi:hypothetical protein
VPAKTPAPLPPTRERPSAGPRALMQTRIEDCRVVVPTVRVAQLCADLRAAFASPTDSATAVGEVRAVTLAGPPPPPPGRGRPSSDGVHAPAGVGGDGMPPAAAVLPTLRRLQTVFVSLECLQETRVGEVVYRLRRHGDAEVREVADGLYARWRADAQEAIKRGMKKAASAPGAGGGGGGGGGGKSVKPGRTAHAAAGADDDGGGGDEAPDRSVPAAAAFLYTAPRVADLVDELEGWEADAAKRFKPARAEGGGGGGGGGATLVMTRMAMPDGRPTAPLPAAAAAAMPTVGSKRPRGDAASAVWRGGLAAPPPPPVPLQWRPTVSAGK